MAAARPITPTPSYPSGPFTASNNRSASPGGVGSHLQSKTQTNIPSFGTHLTNSPRGLSPQYSPQPAQDPGNMSHEPAPASAAEQSAAALQAALATPAADPPKDSTPDPAQMSAPLREVAESIVIPAQPGSGNAQPSTGSQSNLTSAGLTTAATATALEPTAGALQRHEDSASLQQHPQHHQPLVTHQPHQPHQPHQHIAPNLGNNPASRSFTFPPPQPPADEHDPRAPARQLSLPGTYQNPKSPTTKRHKCPYCATDFTRHHNLKSHLLTHSQEKPYECETCKQRFRRLHDLKRHQKLHTGERPHHCTKCGRKFARGDALARHSKGQGGCAGRRASFELNNDGMDGKGDSMEGVIYDHQRDADADEDATGRRESEPARKRQNTGNSSQGPYHQHSSTYPPIAASRAHNNLLPLYPHGHNGPSTNISPKLAQSSISSLHFAANNQANVFGQGGMTESPKPISPSHGDQHRLGPQDGSHPGPRSSDMAQNMTQQMQHQNFHRQPSHPGRVNSASPMGVPPQPHGGAGPHLPPLPPMQGHNHPMIPRQGSQNGTSNGPPVPHGHMSGVEHDGGAPNHGAGNMGGGYNTQDVLAAMRQQLHAQEEERKRSEEEHKRQMALMQQDIQSLRAQLAQQMAKNADQVQQQPQQQPQPEEQKIGQSQ